MGEMADMALDEVMDMEDSRLEYKLGHMSEFEAYEKGITNERGGYLTPYSNSFGITCRCCKTSGLRWIKVRNKFRLFEGEDIHHCPVNPLRE